MDEMRRIEAQMRDPEKAARFFAFMDYGPGRITEWLVNNLGVHVDDAYRIAKEAVEKRVTDESQDVARMNRAVIAEHDLGESNWR